VLEKLASQDSVFEPFAAIFKGFWDVGSLFIPRSAIPSKKASGPRGNPDAAVKQANIAMWMVYNNYKKAHKLLSW
jgi:hypothetical protein